MSVFLQQTILYYKLSVFRLLDYFTGSGVVLSFWQEKISLYLVFIIVLQNTKVTKMRIPAVDILLGAVHKEFIIFVIKCRHRNDFYF